MTARPEPTLGADERWIKVNGSFDELVISLNRAESKGYMPDALAGEWEKFDWREDDRAALAAPAVVVSAEPVANRSDEERIERVWQAMTGGPEGWLKSFGYMQFARAVIDEFSLREGEDEHVAEVERMPGTTGFGIAVFKNSEVPLGTRLYTRPATPVGPDAVDARDAARYRWLRDNYIPPASDDSDGMDRAILRGGDAMAAAIDAALASTKPSKGAA